MLSESRFEEIYIACGYTDLRYGIDGLATTVKEKFGLNPFSPNTIFLFCGRRSDRIKALIWEGLSAHFCYPNHFDKNLYTLRFY